MVGVGLVGPPSAEQQERPVLEPAPEVRQRVERRGVTPLEVVGEDDAVHVRKRAGDDVRRGLEEAKLGPGFLEPAARRRAELGQDARELAGERRRRRLGRCRHGRAQQLREDAIGEPLLAGMRAHGQDRHAAHTDRGERLRRQPGLADARLALDHHDGARPPECGMCVEQLAELGVAARQCELDRLRADRRIGQRHGRAAAADRVVELVRLRERRDAELAVEHPHAVAVLGEGVAATPRAGVEVDQPAVRRLVQPVELEPVARRHDRLVEAVRRHEGVRKAVEQLRMLASHDLLEVALPVVELDAVAKREAGEEIVARERGRTRELVDARRGQRRDATKLGEVEERPVEHQLDVQPVGPQPRLTQRSPQRRQRPPQRRPSPFRIGIGPEQIRKRRARLRPAPDRQHRQQRRRLPRINRQRRIIHRNNGRPHQFNA